jgi:hypothetical protein
VGRRLRAAAERLNPVLVDAGFMGAQFGGSPSEPVSALYCAAFDEFATRYPRVARALQLPGSDEISCVDLIVEVDGDDLVSSIYLETPELDAICRVLGLVDDAARVASVIGNDVLDSVDMLHPVLVALFSQTEPA